MATDVLKHDVIHKAGVHHVLQAAVVKFGRVVFELCEWTRHNTLRRSRDEVEIENCLGKT